MMVSQWKAVNIDLRTKPWINFKPIMVNFSRGTEEPNSCDAEGYHGSTVSYM
jgi:hypothetical protein